MNKKLIKKRLIEKMEEVINWLYKDQPLITNLASSFAALIWLFIIKLAIIGFQQKLYFGYFEYMVIALLLSILIFQTSFKVSGWGNITFAFVLIAGVGLIVYDTTSLLPVAGEMIGLFAVGHILFIMFSTGIRYVSNHRRTCELLLRKFFRKRKKSLISIKEENQK